MIAQDRAVPSLREAIRRASRRWRCRPARAVAPKAIAVSKSLLIPIDSEARPRRFAILARRAKCGAGASSTGGMHIRPSMARPWTSRQRATKASVSSGRMPAFCGSAPVLTWTRSRRRPPLLRHLLGDRRGDPVAVDGVDRIEQRHGLRAPCWTGAGRSGGDRGPGVAARAPATWPWPPARGSRRTPAGRRRSPAGSRAPRRSSIPRSGGPSRRCDRRRARRPRCARRISSSLSAADTVPVVSNAPSQGDRDPDELRRQ